MLVFLCTYAYSSSTIIEAKDLSIHIFLSFTYINENGMNSLESAQLKPNTG